MKPLRVNRSNPSNLRVRPVRLSRRAVLRGAGTIAVALPWLEAMGTSAQAASAPAAKRFLAVYQPGGTVLDQWTPSGSEDNFELSPILAPLAPLKDKLLVLSGVDMKSAVGEQHQAGIVALLTGTPQDAGRNQFAGGPSIDQVIAKTASAGKPRPSIEMAIRWATGKSHGLLHPINSLNFADNASFSPIPPRLDPQEIWESLFGAIEPGGGDGGETPTVDPAQLRKRSILDFLDRRYETLAQRVGQRDRAKLDEHLTRIREMEATLDSLTSGDPMGQGAACMPPAIVDTEGYNPSAGLQADDNGDVKDTSSDAAIPEVGKFMMDMMVMAMGCDLTAVGTLQWSDTEAKHTFPWLNLSEHHHYYQHDGGFRPVECAAIDVWYSEQHLYLLQQMAAIDMGGTSLLDESIVFFGSELQDPPTHVKNDMPFFLAGGGGMRTGRWLNFNGRSHNDLLVALLNLFGDSRTSFGTDRYNGGALTGLT